MSFLALAAIVKNEASCIEATLRSVKPYIGYYALLDTLSTDNTKQIAMACLEGVSGTYKEEPFIDFATSRNRSLDLVAEALDKPTFTLVMSADEKLYGGEALIAFLEKQPLGTDAFAIELRTDTSISLSTRIVRTGSKWRFEGAVHEQLVPTPMLVSKSVQVVPTVPGVYIEHRATDSQRRIESIRNVHVPLLIKELEKNPHSKRAMLFLAESYKILAQIDGSRETLKKALDLYVARTLEGGSGIRDTITDKDECLYAEMNQISCAIQLGLLSADQIYECLMDLSKRDPSRPETAHMLAGYTANMNVEAGYISALKAVDIAIEAKRFPSRIPSDRSCEWQSWLLAARCARQLGNKENVEKCFRAGLEAGGPAQVFSEFGINK